MAKGPTVKKGKEAYLECLTRCERGFRCRRCGGAAAATDPRNCALCAATSSPGHSRAEERIWSYQRAKENWEWQCRRLKPVALQPSAPASGEILRNWRWRRW